MLHFDIYFILEQEAAASTNRIENTLGFFYMLEIELHFQLLLELYLVRIGKNWCKVKAGKTFIVSPTQRYQDSVIETYF